LRWAAASAAASAGADRVGGHHRRGATVVGKKKLSCFSRESEVSLPPSRHDIISATTAFSASQPRRRTRVPPIHRQLARNTHAVLRPLSGAARVRRHSSGSARPDPLVPRRPSRSDRRASIRNCHIGSLSRCRRAAAVEIRCRPLANSQPFGRWRGSRRACWRRVLC